MNIIFDGISRTKWIQTIVKNRNISIETKEPINLIFNSISNPEEIEPFHIVLLACFIQYLKIKGYHGMIDPQNEDVYSFLKDNLQFDKYFSEETDFIKAKDFSVLNLWKVTEDRKETYSEQVHDFLKNSFFKNKDLSAVKNSLLECYYNIFDHADANGNAFSFTKYNEENQKLYVAICDFGKGIASSIRSKYNVQSDKDAIQMAIEIGISVKSKIHNKGFGLNNILSTLASDDKLRILSNSGFLFAIGGKIKTFDIDFQFNGTLLYYELSIQDIEELEINEIMNLDF